MCHMRHAVLVSYFFGLIGHVSCGIRLVRVYLVFLFQIVVVHDDPVGVRRRSHPLQVYRPQGFKGNNNNNKNKRTRHKQNYNNNTENYNK